MKPLAAITASLFLAIFCGRIALCADADHPAADPDHPVVVEVPEQKDGQSNQPPASVAEIPAANDGAPSQAPPAPGSLSKQTVDYDGSNSPPPVMPDLHSLREFMDQMTETSPLGLELREERTSLKNGETVSGLAVISVSENSPAARAGVRPYSGTTHAVLEGATMAATMVFPPAIVALTIIDQTHVGESYDLIIGVDGTRVCDLLQFEDQTRTLKPGDTVYLNIVRGGSRMQIPVLLPPLTQASK